MRMLPIHSPALEDLPLASTLATISVVMAQKMASQSEPMRSPVAKMDLRVFKSEAPFS